MTTRPPQSHPEPLTNVTTVRVTYRDTDRMGHVYYANYLVWFEIGRTEMLRDLGMTYREWEDVHGIFLPVASCWIDYHKGALYDDVVRIETRISVLTRASITFEYRLVHDTAGDLLATGGTRHPFLSKDGRVVRVAHKVLPDLFARMHQGS